MCCTLLQYCSNQDYWSSNGPSLIWPFQCKGPFCWLNRLALQCVKRPQPPAKSSYHWAHWSHWLRWLHWSQWLQGNRDGWAVDTSHDDLKLKPLWWLIQVDLLNAPAWLARSQSRQSSPPPIGCKERDPSGRAVDMVSEQLITTKLESLWCLIQADLQNPPLRSWIKGRLADSMHLQLAFVAWHNSLVLKSNNCSKYQQYISKYFLHRSISIVMWSTHICQNV